MTKLLLPAFAAVAMLALAAAPADARRPVQGWQVIGYKTVGFGTDRDVIRVRGNDRFREVRLCAINRPIRLHDFAVTFANGGRQDLQVRNRIAAGSCTRAIDLRGNARNIDTVELTYERIDRRLGAPLIRVTAR